MGAPETQGTPGSCQFGLALQAAADAPALHLIAMIEAPENEPADLRKNPGEAEVW